MIRRAMARLCVRRTLARLSRPDTVTIIYPDGRWVQIDVRKRDWSTFDLSGWIDEDGS